MSNEARERDESMEMDTLMRRPNMLIIGAQKCGTHWLHASLKTHPGAYMSVEKEPHFFNNAERLTTAGFAAYLQEHFSAARDETIVGEASTGYFRTRYGPTRWASPRRAVDVPNAVLRFLGGEVRLIVGIRQPVERAISAYLHHWGKGRMPANRKLIDVGAEYGIVDIGFYHRHLTRWTEVFSRDRCHVVLLEDIHERPREAFAAVCSFLDLEPTQPQEGFSYKGFDLEWEGDRLVVSAAGRREIARKMKEKRLGASSAEELPSVECRELVELQKIFDEDILRLEEWLGRDLSHWRGDPWNRFVRYGRK